MIEETDTPKPDERAGLPVAPCSAFGRVGTAALVDITRLSRDNEIRLKIRTETGTFELEMTPEQFALALTGRCECPAKIYRTGKRFYRPNDKVSDGYRR
jgi:hypothetical protein